MKLKLKLASMLTLKLKLVAAVKVAGLAGTLSGAALLRILAPTHETFGQLPAGVLDKLSSPRTRRSSSRF